MPSTLASIAGKFTPSGPTYDFSERSWKLHDELSNDYYSRHYKEPEGSTKQIEIDGEYVTKDAEQQEQLHKARLNRRISEGKPSARHHPYFSCYNRTEPS